MQNYNNDERELFYIFCNQNKQKLVAIWKYGLILKFKKPIYNANNMGGLIKLIKPKEKK